MQSIWCLFFCICLVWQIQELIEAIVLPMTHKERFQKLGVRPPKGVLLYGPPGTGKTLMARACAAQTNATFLKLAGPQLVQVWFSFSFSNSFFLLSKYILELFLWRFVICLGIICCVHSSRLPRIGLVCVLWSIDIDSWYLIIEIFVVMMLVIICVLTNELTLSMYRCSLEMEPN